MWKTKKKIIPFGPKLRFNIEFLKPFPNSQSTIQVPRRKNPKRSQSQASWVQCYDLRKMLREHPSSKASQNIYRLNILLVLWENERASCSLLPNTPIHNCNQGWLSLVPDDNLCSFYNWFHCWLKCPGLCERWLTWHFILNTALLLDILCGKLYFF